ncbi:hypothetical protein TPHA_0H00840 [Tetrapisispora phaffii CBS 4417]|uniref:Telomeric single stranded DNA binding POT1/Cdc13 domain-containing protein n=1 Tax=Tetrapisispora phaffii (strain ATCC 24235 / CBS 4417 / NBRC 1672 / NRRL Y-8282 / UCD 70-5) TaxID=1071381 RepID=G8BWY8_TETPH|nr:hypothetical protein TPHA_0H00840 [Tetrapisispora phaffii CBS 4417]CCE64292.1 hypothetical protein TPHA_0H00840 [Tetrapisispora phaffii CBS 4417]
MDSIALLSRITLVNDKFTLYFHDGHVLSHIVLNKSNEKIDFYNSKIIVTLLFKNFNIDLLLDKQPFDYNNIHHRKLIFVSYLFKDNILQELFPLNLTMLKNLIKTRNEDLLNIFKYLISSSLNQNDPFTLEMIIDDMPEELIDMLGSIETNKLAPTRKRQLSQELENNIEDDDINELIETSSDSDNNSTDNSVYTTPKQYQRKVRKLNANEVAIENMEPPKTFLPYPQINTKETKTGKLIAMFPTYFNSMELLKNTKIHLFFIPEEMENEHQRTLPNYELKPNINCIEFVMSVKEMQQVFGKIEDSKSLKTIAFNKDSIIDFQLMKIAYKNNLYSAIWKLKRFRVNTKKKVKKTNSRKNASFLNNVISNFVPSSDPDNAANVNSYNGKPSSPQSDPILQFSGLVLKPGETKYFQLYCILLACSDESHSFLKLTVTDFTKNTMIQQKYLIDKFLIDYNNKIDDNEGIRLIMYPNVFKPFNEKVKKLYNKEIKDMFIGTSKNLSDKGILCKMTIKANLYSDKLNAIVRECEPIPVDEFTSLTDHEKFYVEKLYSNTFPRITHYSQRFVLDYYKICFPFEWNNLKLVLTLPVKKNVPILNPHLLNNRERYGNKSIESDFEEDSESEDDSESESQEENGEDWKDDFDPENDANETDYTLFDDTSSEMLSSRFTEENDFYKLNQVPLSDRQIYTVKTEIVNVDCNKFYFEYFLRSQDNKDNFVDPRKTINAIINPTRRLKRFFNLTEAESKPDKILQSINSRYASDIKRIINQNFTLKLNRNYILLSKNVKLLTWSLVGVTMEELNPLNTNNTIEVKLEI